MIESPCTKLCRLLDGTDVCAGCHRTLSEIAAWPALNHEEQVAILAALSARRLAATLRF